MKALPIVCAVNREVRVESTEESSNGGVGSAQGISVGKKSLSFSFPSKIHRKPKYFGGMRKGTFKSA